MPKNRKMILYKQIFPMKNTNNEFFQFSENYEIPNNYY